MLTKIVQAMENSNDNLFMIGLSSIAIAFAIVVLCATNRGTMAEQKHSPSACTCLAKGQHTPESKL